MTDSTPTPRGGADLPWPGETVHGPVPAPRVIPADRVTVHYLDAEDAYGTTQCDETIADGDVLVVGDAVGVMVEAWPVAVNPAAEALGFHALEPGADIGALSARPYGRRFAATIHPPGGERFDQVEHFAPDGGADYRASWDVARESIRRILGEHQERRELAELAERKPLPEPEPEPEPEPMPYVRDSYIMERVELVAPAVTNDGAPSGYAERVRGVLLDHGLGGWTEFETVGAWQGVREPGTTFVLYLPNGHALDIVHELADDLRAAMPDQDAIQAVVFPAPVTLMEL